MTVVGKIRIELRYAVTIAAALVALAGCQQKKEGDVPEVDPAIGEHIPRTEQGDVKAERNLAQAEIDTLRAWKLKLNITRDEYWEDRGGVLANDWGEVWYAPGKTTVSHGMYAFHRMNIARRVVHRTFGTVPAPHLVVTCTVSIPFFEQETHLGWWHYGLITDNEITLQPIPVLFQRNLVDIAPDHEYYRWAVRVLSGGNAPRWLEHGLASHLSGEGKVLHLQLAEFPRNPVLMTIDDAEQAIRSDRDKESLRMGLYNAWMTVDAIVAHHGVEPLAATVRALADGTSMDEASRAHLGAPWPDVVTDALAWQKEWKR